MRVTSICIIGGGSAGWMTAAALVKTLPNIKLTLIESENIGTIGVGESTLAHINAYMDILGLKDEDWMSKCNAIYKTSIKFTDFSNKGETWHYPFGLFDVTDSGGSLRPWFEWQAFDSTVKNSNFAEYFHSSVDMTNQNKLTKNENNEIRGFNFKHHTAYQFEAALFGNFLRDNFCLFSDMKHIIDEIVEVNLKTDGSVKSLSTKNTGELIADLYIDCTGFKALLLGKALKVPYISYNKELINDQAVVTHIPYINPEIEMESVTNCIALESGWAWNNPLWNKIGAGYVYSSKFASKEEAEIQFRKHLASKNMVISDKDRAKNAEFHHIKFRHGTHETSWKHNVLGIGLASGFIEPLESTALFLTHENILFLIRTLKRRNGLINKWDIDSFNFSVRDIIEKMRQFICQHYALSSRRDTPYWKHVTEEITYDNVTARFESPKHPNPQENSFVELAIRLNIYKDFDTSMKGIAYIATGMGYGPIDISDILLRDARIPIEEKKVVNNWKKTKAVYEEHRTKTQSFIDKMPSHYQFLKDNIYND